MGNTIYASFNDPSLAEKAAGALLDHGVRNEDISIVQNHTKEGEPAVYTRPTAPGFTPTSAGDVIVAEPGLSNSVAGIYTTDPEAIPFGGEARDLDGNPITTPRTYVIDNPDETEDSAKYGISTTTSADAGAGALKGTAWGAGIGAVAALASMVVPGVGLVIGGGALATAIGGMIATAGAGAVAGAVTGYLKDQGVDQHVAEHYDNTVTNGGALLAVTVPSGIVTESEARMVLDKYGAANVNAYTSRGYLS
jgi:uncharacterized membrane protein